MVSRYQSQRYIVPGKHAGEEVLRAQFDREQQLRKAVADKQKAFRRYFS
jgi:hypothetical protein